MFSYNSRRPRFMLALFVGLMVMLLSSSALAQSGTSESTSDLVVAARQMPTITYRRAIPLPRLFGTQHLPLNDSGLGATDLHMGISSTLSGPGSVWKSRILVFEKALYRMYEKGDGTAYFGTRLVSTAQWNPGSVAERHINTNSDFHPEWETWIGAMGGSYPRYMLINPGGQQSMSWEVKTTGYASISFGGNNTSIMTGGSAMTSINHNTGEVTLFHGDVLEETGKAFGTVSANGGLMSQAYGADNNLYLLDYDNRRILTFDTGVNAGGTRGKLLGTFDLDPTKTAINAMTVDLAGNFYVGDGEGGFNMYGKDGQWKQGFHDTYEPDPNAVDLTLRNGGYRPYMNYYASGLNDGNGTLDIRDGTGYRQYSIKAPTNTTPTATNDSYSTDEDTTLNVTAASGVIANDTDTDNDVLTATLLTSPSNAASFTLHPDGSFSYTPAANFNGSDSFTYNVSDGTVDSDIATVSITVTAVNDNPVAVNDTAATTRNTSVAIFALSNDFDIEGDLLTVTGFTQPAKGSVDYSKKNNNFRYTPRKGFAGTDTFTYTISDGKGGTATATVTVTVK